MSPYFLAFVLLITLLWFQYFRIEKHVTSRYPNLWKKNKISILGMFDYGNSLIRLVENNPETAKDKHLVTQIKIFKAFLITWVLSLFAIIISVILQVLSS